MPSVVLGKVGANVVVDSDTCVKTGRPTTDRLTIRGDTMPGWVHVLLVLTVIGWVVAMALTSRRYGVDLPYSREVHVRWRRLRVLSWVVVLVGLVAFWFSDDGQGYTDPVVLVVPAIGFLLMGLNMWIHSVGVRQDADGRLLLVRVHPAAAAAIRDARGRASASVPIS